MKIRLKHTLPLLFATLVLVPLGCVSEAAAQSATDHIRVRIEKIYQLLQASGSGPEAPAARQASARRVLDEMFDWTEMAKRSLGEYWNDRTPAERNEFVQLFAELFQRTYLSRIEIADRERFQYVDERIEGDAATVKTIVVTKKGHQIPVDYLSRRVGGSWKVHDLSVSGTSLVNNYRSQFTTLIARSSYQDLIDKLRQLAKAPPASSGAEPARSSQGKG